MEATVSTETVSDTTASTTGPSYEDEDAWLPWEDYGECSNTVKDFYNDDGEKDLLLRKWDDVSFFPNGEVCQSE